MIIANCRVCSYSFGLGNLFFGFESAQYFFILLYEWNPNLISVNMFSKFDDNELINSCHI